MTINYSTGSISGSDGSMRTNLYPLIMNFRTVSASDYEYSRQLYLYETGRYPDIVGGTVSAFLIFTNVEVRYGVFAGYSSVVSGTIFYGRSIRWDACPWGQAEPP